MMNLFWQVFGPVNPPAPIVTYGSLQGGGLVKFLNIILQTLVVIAGLYFLVNLILAGYQFMSAGGDSKNIEAAWGKIWQSIIGLLIVAASFLLAAIFGILIFNDWQAILKPQIFKP